MIYELFDPNGETTVREGSNLPHWCQQGVTYFVTIRTEDSIPAATARIWRQRRADWLLRCGVEIGKSNWMDALARLPRQKQQQFHETFSQEYLDALDQGRGACLLQNGELAKIVADSLLYFDGSRYCLGDFVVMPNHLHLLVCLLDESEIEGICYSWKKYSATRINRRSGRRGRFWQEESFDHLVRSADQLDAIRRYIAGNPRRANLPAGSYLHYRK
jgi:type I restriction enzyme R subunit